MAATDQYQLRLARPQDWPGIARLLPMAGVPVQDELRLALEDGLAGDIARHAVVSEEARMAAAARHMQGGLSVLFAASAVVLVATRPGLDPPVAVCVLNPPGVVMRQMSDAGASLAQLLLVMTAVAKIPALVVDPDHRGAGLGQELVRRTASLAQVGASCVYGQIRLDDGLADWYRRAGFTVLPSNRSIDLARLIGSRVKISPMPGEQLFLSEPAPAR